MSHVFIAVIVLAAFVLGFVLRGLFQMRGDVPADEKQYGKHKKKLHDDATNDDYDFYENENAEDDPKKPGYVGKLEIVGAAPDEVSIWLNDDPKKEAGKSVELKDIDCGHMYYVTRHKFTDKTDKTCGGPDEFAAQYKAVKDQVLAEAVRVADRCKRKPSCGASIEFQAGLRSCWQKAAPDKWVLEIQYQVRVVCLKQ